MVRDVSFININRWVGGSGVSGGCCYGDIVPRTWLKDSTVLVCAEVDGGQGRPGSGLFEQEIKGMSLNMASAQCYV